MRILRARLAAVRGVVRLVACGHGGGDVGHTLVSSDLGAVGYADGQVMTGKPSSSARSAIAFAVAVGALGWLLSTVLAYALFATGELGELWVHKYIDVACLVLSVGALATLTLASHRLVRRGTRFGNWVSSGGTLGERRHLLLVTSVPITVFLCAEYVERVVFDLLDAPTLSLLIAGVCLQALIGVVMFAVSRRVLRTVERIILEFIAALFSPAPVRFARVVVADLPRLGVLAGSRADRAPPRRIAA